MSEVKSDSLLLPMPSGPIAHPHPPNDVLPARFAASAEAEMPNMFYTEVSEVATNDICASSSSPGSLGGDSSGLESAASSGLEGAVGKVRSDEQPPATTSTPPSNSGVVEGSPIPLIRTMNELSLAHVEVCSDLASGSRDDLVFLLTPPVGDMRTLSSCGSGNLKTSISKQPTPRREILHFSLLDSDMPLEHQVSNMGYPMSSYLARRMTGRPKRVENQSLQHSYNHFSQPVPFRQPVDTSLDGGAEPRRCQFQQITLQGASDERAPMPGNAVLSSHWLRVPQRIHRSFPDLPAQSCGASPDAETIDPTLVVDTLAVVNPIDVRQLYQPEGLEDEIGESVAEGRNSVGTSESFHTT